jgi:thioredoxin reductase (NADPH)
MSDRFAAQLSSRIEVKLSAEVSSINALRSYIECGGEKIGYGSLVFAAGVRRRKLSAVEEFSGAGILTSGAKEKTLVQGRRVVIVGGGDAALENALILSEYAGEVIVVHRRDEFSARPEFVKKAEQAAKVTFIMNSEIEKLHGGEKLRFVSVRNNTTGEISEIETDHLLVRCGTEPNSELLRGIVETDARGYVIVDANCRTSAPHIYAAGDIANPISPTIATAAGTGATAAKTAFTKLQIS